MLNIISSFSRPKSRKKSKSIFSPRGLLTFSSMIAFSSVFIPNASYATENGLTHYPQDVDTVANAILPAPGTAALDIYTLWYNASSFAGPKGKSEVPGFDSSSSIISPRLIYTLPQTFTLFNFFQSSVTGGIIFPLLNLNVQLNGQHKHIMGGGDFTFETDFSMNRPQNDLFFYVGMDTFIPTGSYNPNRIANLGYNYYSFEPLFNLTWFPNSRLEIDEAGVFDLNTTNGATHYHSGTDFDDDYAIHYTAFPDALPNVNFGVQGNIDKQIQDDTVYGKVYNNGNRGQSFGIGPQITFNMFHDRGGIDIKFTHQFAVRNQPQGDKLWVEFGIPLG